MNNQAIFTSKHLNGNKAMLYGCPANQSGVVLIVSLIMLLLLMLIGTVGMQTTSLEEKMAGNMRDKDLAFQAAESALKAAEASLDVPAAALPAFVNAGTNGFYTDTVPGTTYPDAVAIKSDSFWATANKVHTSTVTTSSGSSEALGDGIAAPIYIIQKSSTAVCFKAACPLPSDLSTPYTITVRATGASAGTVVILQSVYTPA